MQVYRNGIWKGPINTHYYMTVVTASQHLLQTGQQYWSEGLITLLPKTMIHEFLQKDIYKVVFHYLYI